VEVYCRVGLAEEGCGVGLAEESCDVAGLGLPVVGFDVGDEDGAEVATHSEYVGDPSKHSKLISHSRSLRIDHLESTVLRIGSTSCSESPILNQSNTEHLESLVLHIDPTRPHHRKPSGLEFLVFASEPSLVPID